MPPLPRIRHESLADLCSQLQFAPPKAIRRDIERAEALASEVETSIVYPEDWVVFRITGYRPDLDTPRMIEGAMLLSDLSALVERLSDACGIQSSDVEGALTPADLQDRWNVSRKTIDRYRRAGLVARRVGRGTAARLVFMPTSVEAFESRQGERIARGGSFTRLSDDEAAKALERARAMRDEGLRPTRIARRIGQDLGRSHETIRQLLRKEGIFTIQGSITAREGRLAWRAMRRGIEPRTIASALGRRSAAVTRAALEHRADLLRERLPAIRPARESTIEPSRIPSGHDLHFRGDVLERRAESASPEADIERRRLEGASMLRARAVRTIEGLETVTAPAVDRAETDLRHASNLLVTCLDDILHLVLRSLEQASGAELDRLPRRESSRLLRVALRASVEATSAFDPTRGGRLASPVTLAVHRAITALVRTHPIPEARAGARLSSLTIERAQLIPRWARHVAPDPRLAHVAPAMPEPGRSFLVDRFGLVSSPMTLEELAKRDGLTAMVAARRERQSIRDALGRSRT